MPSAQHVPSPLLSSSVAVIGTGYWGKNLVRTFDDLGVLRAVCDTDPARLGAIRTTSEVKRCCRVDDCLKDPDVGAVAIAAPAVSHFELVHSALAAGKDVFVEKPLALTVSDGQELVKLAGDAKRILMVGHILRYHPAVRRLKGLLDAGDLGKVEYVYSNRLSIGKLRTEENILWSFAPHDVSVLLGLLGEMPSAVSCQGGDYLSRGVSDVTVSQFTFFSGVRAHIFVSWLHPFKEQRLVVVGSAKMAVFDDTAEDKLVTYPHKVEWKNRVPTAVKANGEVVPIESTEPLKAECLAFLECLNTRKPPSPTEQKDCGCSRYSMRANGHSPKAARCSLWTRTAPPRSSTSSTIRPELTPAPSSVLGPRSGTLRIYSVARRLGRTASLART